MLYLANVLKWFVFILLILNNGRALSVGDNYSSGCDLDVNLKSEIARYKDVAERIIQYVTKGEFKGRTYTELGNFIDTFGPRLSGSSNLENAIDYMITRAKNEGIQDVTTEDVQVPYWVRGHESLTMFFPRYYQMSLIGLGSSEPTPPEGIQAEVIVVGSFDELNSLNENKVRGKIVVYNNRYTDYGNTVRYRSKGAIEAAKKGAVAALISSITPFSLNTVHTGMQNYAENVTKIPAAAITKEDAHFMSRLYKKNIKIILLLKMFGTLGEKTSRNTLIDLKGSRKPDNLVIVSGHIDSWDIGQGAMDDGGGMVVSWAVPVILKKMGLKPKRTIRSVLWTGEEEGLLGAAAYAARHNNELEKIDFVIESDEGTFTPTGLSVAGSNKTKCIVAEVLNLFSTINSTLLKEDNAPGSDIVMLVSKGVPGAGLLNKNDKYFWYHHSSADTMDVENADDLDLCTAFLAGVAYVLADLTDDLPR